MDGRVKPGNDERERFMNDATADRLVIRQLVEDWAVLRDARHVGSLPHGVARGRRA